MANLALTQTADPGAAAPRTGAVPPEKPATFTDGLRPTFAAQSPRNRVTSKLIGLTISNASNETIGEIADVVFDLDGRVKSWVVGVGCFLGIGTEYVAVDPSPMWLDRSDGKTRKAMIRSAPEYVYLGKKQPKDEAGRGSGAK